MKKTTEALVTLFEIGNKVKEALADDGRVSIPEGIGISMKAIGIIGVIKTLPEITQEIKTSTPAQRLVLVDVFKEKFVLKDKEAEKAVEDGLVVLVNLANMVFPGPHPVIN